jgi:hypothetical protein
MRFQLSDIDGVIVYSFLDTDCTIVISIDDDVRTIPWVLIEFREETIVIFDIDFVTWTVGVGNAFSILPSIVKESNP